MRKSSIEVTVDLGDVSEQWAEQVLHHGTVVSVHGDDECEVDPRDPGSPEPTTTAELLADPSGVRVRVSVPAKRIVCTDCDGDGMVLNEGMRWHAYTAEEVADWDDDDRDNYFRVGGCYDVECPTCKGEKVLDDVDDGAVRPDTWQRAVLDAMERMARERAAYARAAAAERSMGY